MHNTLDNVPLSHEIAPDDPPKTNIISRPLSHDLVVSDGPETTLERVESYASEARSAATRRAYRADLEHFSRWARAAGETVFPTSATTLALYLTQMADAGAKYATICRRIAAINGVHKAAGFPSPSGDARVRDVVRGISRVKGTAPKRKDALTVDLLRTCLGTLDGSLRGTRDRAILLLCFSGAFRRSELAALDVADLKFSRRGLAVTLRRSKTDQEGAGEAVGVPNVALAALCPVRAVKAWLEASGITSGAVFRTIVRGKPTAQRISGAAVALLVQRVAQDAGVSGDFGGHSLRAGFVTSSAAARVPDRDIARTTRHKSLKILHGYVRRANLFDDLGLTEIMR